ncbi:MAG: hypothetical protein Kow0037_15690 [Calditrichia bacterium]
MNRILISLFCVLIVVAAVFAKHEHPSVLITKKEAAQIKSALGRYSLLDKSFEQARQMVEAGIKSGIEVPQPGEAGGYAHERHKQNYREMQTAGLLYTITGEKRYAEFVRDMLLKYAELYPTLGPHPLAHHQAPGRLFHQMLNETVWLLHSAQAYDCIYDFLKPAEREVIERNVFRRIAEWFTTENAKEFNRIHNHGTWSVASVGILGYVLEDQNLVDMALYGTNKDGKGGFLKQLDLLFSPDGYYMEGPYYIRYALRPFFYFAEAIERNQPELKIYDYRDQILKKAYYSAVQTIFPNGVFPPINDASRTMNIAAPGVVLATDLTYSRYGADENLLGLAAFQDQVILNESGLAIAKALEGLEKPATFTWGSVEFRDGYDGEKGGLGILRYGTGNTQSMLLMKYGVHGAGHGHFDKLHFIFFNNGREVVPDYGFSRWINIEPKFGGRYLPENKSYAMQTVAHNTVVVDQQSQNRGNRKEADKRSGKRHFFDASNPDVQVMSAFANECYPGVSQQRTMFLLKSEERESPIVVDLFKIKSEEEHSYDYPLHFRGQLMATSFKYNAFTEMLRPLGQNFGYQHIWNEAEARVDSTIRFTWLDGNKYYTWVTATPKNAQVFLGRTGANDPNFNLIQEPLILMRTRGKDILFASVIEPHGYFNEAGEKSVGATGKITSVNIIGSNEQASVVEILDVNGKGWQIIVTHQAADKDARREVTFGDRTFKWTGNYLVKRIGE